MLRAEVFHESYKFVVLHFQLLFVNRPLSALYSRFHFARLPSLHRFDHGFDELLLGLGEAVFRVELRVNLPQEASRVRMVLLTQTDSGWVKPDIDVCHDDLLVFTFRTRPIQVF